MRIEANGVGIEVEIIGPDDGEPVLLIAGFGQQLTFWPPAMVDRLVAAGHRVVTYDHRDVGLSDEVAVEVEPDIAAVLTGDRSSVAYTLDDLAADAVGLLDALGMARAHVLGHSLGGRVAQLVAADHPARVSTLTLWGTGPGDGSGEMDPEVLTALAVPVSGDRTADVQRVATIVRLAAHPHVADEEYVAHRAAAQVDRWVSTTTGTRQAAAMIAAGDLSDRLRRLAVPTLVIHGTGDRFFGVSGGRALARLIPGATLVEVEGMGHTALADDHLADVAEAIVAHTSQRH